MKELILRSILVVVPVTAGAEDLHLQREHHQYPERRDVARKHRFEVADVTGSDVADVQEDQAGTAGAGDTQEPRRQFQEPLRGGTSVPKGD